MTQAAEGIAEIQMPSSISFVEHCKSADHGEIPSLRFPSADLLVHQ
ncbi:hypothetical protein [Candidatus Binatus sp.]|nr:hypothetical protein [Candidatus Binatus sp.]